MNLDWVQQEAGISNPILTDTQTPLKYVQDGWLLGIRRFLATVQGTITFSTGTPPEAYRQGDTYIMDLCSSDGLLTADTRQLNRCRLYFQVARLSNIVTITGTLLYHMFYRFFETSTHQHTHNFHKQHSTGLDNHNQADKHANFGKGLSLASF
jgi:hypothetical protein